MERPPASNDVIMENVTGNKYSQIEADLHATTRKHFYHHNGSKSFFTKKKCTDLLSNKTYQYLRLLITGRH